MRLVKLGAAVLNQIPFDWDNNIANIKAAIDAARCQQTSILCLPELCLTGYGCEDDFFRPDLQKRAWELLQEVAQYSKDIIVSVGLPVFFANSLFNCAALIVDGRVVGLAAKKNLAGDGIHYEPRWFQAWEEDVVIEAEIFGQRLPLGDIHYNISGIKIGFEICEEAWVGQRPGGKLSARAVDIILNPSASHFSFGKFETRKRLVLEGSRAFGGTYIYTNLLGNEAGRAIYDGGAIIAQSGNLLALGPRLSFADWCLTTAVIDVEITRMRQARTYSFQPDLEGLEAGSVHLNFEFPELTPCMQNFSNATNSLKQSQIKQDKWEKGNFLKEEEFARSVALGLYDYLRKSHSKGFAVSLSGGADSAAVSSLVYLMVKLGIAELGKEEFLRKLSYIKGLDKLNDEEIVSQLLLCVYQGTCNSSDITKNAAKSVAEALNARFYELDIDPLLQKYNDLAESVLGRKLDWKVDDLPMQNIQARVRAPGIWYLANLFGMILLCTSNRSEGAVGYCTMDGDTSGGLSPIAGIDKNYLRKWLSWLEKEGVEGLAPLPALEAVTKQAPTAELRPLSMSQTDEKDLMPYEILDEIESAAIEDNRSPLECYQILRALSAYKNYSANELAAFVERFFRLWSINQWKRERLAPALHVASRNLDPRTWRRSPILSGCFKSEIKEMWKYVSSESGSTKQNLNTKVIRALIRVDLQNDFMPGGALAVSDGDKIISTINELSASGYFNLEIDTQDFHPKDHSSFSKFPVHCVANTNGAEFHKDLVRKPTTLTFRKGMDIKEDGFSGFSNTELAPYLQSQDVSEIFVVGLATDYCVKATALDAVKAGFRTYVVSDACRAVDKIEGENAIKQMLDSGIKVIESSSILFNKNKIKN